MAKNNAKTILQNWDEATNAVAQLFVKKYFGKDVEYFWVGDKPGDVFHVNDYWFNLDRMREALELNCPFDLLIQFYDYELDRYEKDLPVEYNFKNYVRYYKGFSA